MCSLTRAAAHEVASRNPPIPKNRIGTLHSLAYQALGAPPVAQKHLADWNRDHPQYRITGGMIDPDDPFRERTRSAIGGELLSEYSLRRTRMLERATWPQRSRDFARAWESWKDQNGLIDFTDMIEHALLEADIPGEAHVIFADECQDHNRLELELLRKWAEQAEDLIIVGDPYQALYTWRGAYPEMFHSEKIAPDRRFVLSQSYRVPRRVHRVAMSWIRQLSDYRPIEYRPRDEEGLASRLNGANWKYPDPVITYAEHCANDGLRVMICASCGYFLGPTIARLRKQGLPFANPYRKNSGDWNPLWSKRGSSIAQAIAAFLKPLTNTSTSFCFGHNVPGWTTGDLHQWLELIKTEGVLTRGAKKEIAESARGESALSHTPLDSDRFRRCFSPEAQELLQTIEERSLEEALRWLKPRLLPGKDKTASYAIRVVERYGVAALTGLPRISIGTIHSFKGAEADVVIIYPDLSRAGMQQWVCLGEGRDSIVRMSYVALTQARQEVRVCTPAGGMSANIWECLN